MHSTGKVVSLADNSVTFACDNDGSTHTRAVDGTATVTLNGQPAKLADLKSGDHVAFDADPAKTVTATRKP